MLSQNSGYPWGAQVLTWKQVLGRVFWSGCWLRRCFFSTLWKSPTHTLNSCPFLIYIYALTLYLKIKFTTKTWQNSNSSSYTLFKKSNCSITIVNIFQNTFSLTLGFPKSTEFFLKKHQDDNHAVLVASLTNQEWPLFLCLGSYHMDSGHRLKRLGQWVCCHLASSLSHFGSENLNMETNLSLTK